ncbi:AcrR family transcriptional regulator [Kutzneria viridogrisea]|uniref:AcrR family transcriptional regulator n=1 Tax=Kutzneria viridogrisea TaxID=47990 RepID=A0ABR6BCP8_9PSEU|nr:AcrR family transcriptional regulator [Kutzneria viridogrisea]
MVSRQDWLTAGLEILAAKGAPALTVDRLTARLGLTKGSFYHHFAGMAGYRTALLAHFEAECTTRFIDQVESEPDAPADRRLRRLGELVLAEHGTPALEIAMRAWALQDAEVRAVQERVDRTRVDYLRGLQRQLGRAPEIGDLVYLVLVGGSHVVPALEPAQLSHLWDLVLEGEKP